MRENSARFPKMSHESIMTLDEAVSHNPVTAAPVLKEMTDAAIRTAPAGVVIRMPQLSLSDSVARTTVIGAAVREMPSLALCAHNTFSSVTVYAPLASPDARTPDLLLWLK